MQQIYRGTPMPKCDFNKVAVRHRCSPVNLLHIFRTPFLKNTSGRLLLYCEYLGPLLRNLAKITFLHIIWEVSRCNLLLYIIFFYFNWFNFTTVKSLVSRNSMKRWRLNSEKNASFTRIKKIPKRLPRDVLLKSCRSATWLNFSWQRFLSYRNQSIHFIWFLCDRDLFHERV